MAELQLPGKTVDLDTVKDLSDEDFDGLLTYAKQWDDPRQDSWLEEIQDARGAKKTTTRKKAAEGDEE